MDKAIIIGAGTYGAVYAEYLKDSNKYKLIGFLDDDETKHNMILNDLKVLGSVKSLENIDNEELQAVFAPIGDNIVRVKLLNYAASLGFKIPKYIHPTSQIHQTTKKGDSLYVLQGTQIMPHSIIEDDVMISMGVNIAHHTTIRKGCFISQGANIGASIEIGEGAFIGIGATIMTGIKYIGKWSTIGAGAVIIRDVPDKAVVVGNPGKIIRYND